MLYRVFPMEPGGRPDAPGGPLYVPRPYQGPGRHDNPDRYGALYASRSAASAVAELLQPFVGRRVGARHLTWEGGKPYALATLDDSALPEQVDLDDPRELVRRRLRPSLVATRNRKATRALARRLYEAGAAGIAWWSTIEASWINVTLFAERAADPLRVEGEPEPLSVGHPAVVEAAGTLGLELAG